MEDLPNSDLTSTFDNFDKAFGDMSWIFPVIGIILMFLLIVYIYNSLTMMIIAKKLGSKNAWMAWIPFANIYLNWEISQTPQWTMIVYFIGIFAGAIPLIGILISLGISIIAVFWFWRICERLGKPGWWSIFSLLFLPVWLVMLGILAWGETTLTQIPPVSPSTPPSAPNAPSEPTKST